jgi:hypothetical protein
MLRIFFVFPSTLATNGLGSGLHWGAETKFDLYSENYLSKNDSYVTGDQKNLMTSEVLI